MATCMKVRQRHWALIRRTEIVDAHVKYINLEDIDLKDIMFQCLSIRLVLFRLRALRLNPEIVYEPEPKGLDHWMVYRSADISRISYSTWNFHFDVRLIYAQRFSNFYEAYRRRHVRAFYPESYYESTRIQKGD